MPRGSRRQASLAQGGPQLPEPFVPCPVRTGFKTLPHDDEIKAYKLGKRRWSYNQCAVKIQHPHTGQEIDVLDCMQYGPPTLTSKEQESGVTYQVRLENGLRVRINVFAVYDSPAESYNMDGQLEYVWPCITRKACPKGHCEGPILRTIQRFGKLGRRSGTNSEGSEGVMKNAKFMFVSIDEAGSHVGMRHFRMVMGMYSMGDNQLLASTISGPIRVLANNDVPTGAAYIPFKLQASLHWEGWRANLQARLPDSIRTSGCLDSDLGPSSSSRCTEVGSGSLQVKSEPDFKAPLGDILKQHAAEFSLDSDLGANRLHSAFSQHGYNIVAAAGAPRLTDPNLCIPSPDEETICFSQEPMGLAGFTPVYGLSMPPLNGPSGTYSPVLSSLSANDIIYANGSPNFAYGNYVRFPPIPTTMPNPFHEMTDTAMPDDWYDPELLENGLNLELSPNLPSPAQLHAK